MGRATVEYVLVLVFVLSLTYLLVNYTTQITTDMFNAGTETLVDPYQDAR